MLFHPFYKRHILFQDIANNSNPKPDRMLKNTLLRPVVAI